MTPTFPPTSPKLGTVRTFVVVHRIPKNRRYSSSLAVAELRSRGGCTTRCNFLGGLWASASPGPSGRRTAARLLLHQPPTEGGAWWFGPAAARLARLAPLLACGLPFQHALYRPLHVQRQTCLRRRAELRSAGAVAAYKKMEHTEHVCKICDETFHGQFNWMSHNKNEHKKDIITAMPFKCLQCEKTFRMKADLTLHVSIIHEQKSRKTCPECSKLFFESDLQDHLKNIHKCELVYL